MENANEYDDLDLIEYCVHQALAAAVATSPMCDLWADRALQLVDKVRGERLAGEVL